MRKGKNSIFSNLDNLELTFSVYMQSAVLPPPAPPPGIGKETMSLKDTFLSNAQELNFASWGHVCEPNKIFIIIT